VETAAAFQKRRPELAQFIEPVFPQLKDDHTAPTLNNLLDNLAETVPYFWVGRLVHGTAERSLVTAANLDYITPGHSAHIHGVRHISVRHHPIVAATILTVMETAFTQLQVLQLKAEFNQTNRAVLGFCWQFGFRQLARLPRASMVNGQAVDVLTYTLSAERYFTHTRRKLIHVLRQKEKHPETPSHQSPTNHYQCSV